jgi:hypothetical protein
MCDICRRSICPSSCPNAPEPERFGTCSVCGAKILDGEDYYNINDDYWCEECIRDARRTAEV